MSDSKRKVRPFTRKATIEEQFEARWEPVPEAGCWIWTGAYNNYGYGVLWWNYRPILAHRYSWQIHKGPIPENRILCHTCNTRCCINPDHLYAGTPKTNYDDSVRAGTATGYPKQQGEQVGGSKLKEVDIRIIRRSSDTNENLARRFGISPSHMSRVRRGLYWNHIEPQEQKA